MTDEEVKSFTSRKLAIQNAMMKDSRVLPNEFKVAAALLSHANVDTGLIYPSQELVAIEIGVSVPTVKRAIRSLTDKGWLKVSRSNRHVANRYEFLTDHVEAIEDIHREVRDALAERRERDRSAPAEAEGSREGSNTAEGSPVTPQAQSGGITGDTSEGSPVIPKHLKVTPKVEASNINNTEVEVLSPGDPSAAFVTSKADPSEAEPAPLPPEVTGAEASPPHGSRAPRLSSADDRGPAPDPTIPTENGVQLTQPLMVLRDGRLAHVANADGEVIGTFPTEAQAFMGMVRLRRKHGLPDPPYPWDKPNPINGNPIIPADFDTMLEEQVERQARRDRLKDRDAA